MASFLTLLASSSAEDSGGGIGLLLILATLVAIVVVIGAVWTFVGRRASRTPTRTPHHHDQGVRGS
jgi:hypothetical protein